MRQNQRQWIDNVTINHLTVALPLYLQDKMWKPMQNEWCTDRKKELKTGKKEGEFSLSVSLNV